MFDYEGGIMVVVMVVIVLLFGTIFVGGCVTHNFEITIDYYRQVEKWQEDYPQILNETSMREILADGKITYHEYNDIQALVQDRPLNEIKRRVFRNGTRQKF